MLNRIFLFLSLFIVFTANVYAQDLSKVVMKNDRKIEIDYLVEANDTLSKVELYYTEDEGESWKLYGVDADLKPPFIFLAPKDGLFGFKVVTYDVNGNNVGIPDEHTLVEVPYFVDTRAPKLTLKSPMLGEIWKVGEEVDIEWMATDDKQDLPKNPISISLSYDKGHTWKPLVKQHPNIGHLKEKWKLTSNEISAELLIKLTVIDHAGNFSSVLSEPIQIIGKDDKVSEVYHIKLSDRLLAKKYWETAKVFSGREEYYEAQLHLHKAIHLDPTKADYHFNMAENYIQIGDVEKAMIKFEDAIKIAEDRNQKSLRTLEIYLGYVKFLHSLKKANEEKMVIEKILKIDPDNESAMWYLSLLYEERKNIDEAKSLWKKIAVSERNKPRDSEYPYYSVWRIHAKEKLMKYADH